MVGCSSRSVSIRFVDLDVLVDVSDKPFIKCFHFSIAALIFHVRKCP